MLYNKINFICKETHWPCFSTSDSKSKCSDSGYSACHNMVFLTKGFKSYCLTELWREPKKKFSRWEKDDS